MPFCDSVPLLKWAMCKFCLGFPGYFPLEDYFFRNVQTNLRSSFIASNNCENTLNFNFWTFNFSHQKQDKLNLIQKMSCFCQIKCPQSTLIDKANLHAWIGMNSLHIQCFKNERMSLLKWIFFVIINLRFGGF